MRALFESSDLGGEWVAALLQAFPVPVVVTDLERQEILAVNDAATDFFVMSSDELVGRRIADLTAPSSRAEIDDHVNRVRDGSLVVEKTYLRGDGRIVHARVHGLGFPSNARLGLALIFDTEPQFEVARRVDALASVGALVQTGAADPDELVDRIRDQVNADLGVDLEVEWRERVDHPAARRRLPTEEQDDDAFVYPVSVLGREAGRLRLRFREDAPSGLDRSEDAYFVVLLASLVGVAHVISELADSERRYRALVEPLPDAVLRLSPDGIILDANPTAVSMALRDDILGLPIDDVTGEETARMVHDHIDEVVTTGRPVEVWRHRLDPADRAPGFYVLRFGPERNERTGQIDAVHIVASEITEMVEHEQRLASMALVDALTGVANRTAVFDRLQHALDRLQRSDRRPVAVAVIDLDHFKSINDTFGHAVGDEALRIVADAIGREIRPADTIGRLGGDEFVVIFEDVPDRDRLDHLGARLVDAVTSCTPTLPDGQSMPLECSVGLAWTSEPVAADELVARADRAMYEAKRHGRGRSWVEVDSAGTRRNTDSRMRRDLSAALDRNQYELRYQPIVDATTGTIVAAEALLRWHHDGMLRSPRDFLHELVDSGRMGAVGEWVMGTAIDQVRQWRAEPATAHLAVHVNVSPAELAGLTFVDRMGKLLSDPDLDAGSVVVEITEQALTNMMVSRSVVTKLADTGARIALDDFGTGMSSLAHLRSRPLHTIKIDRSFVIGAASDEVDAQIASATIALAGSLGLQVVAEGVETDDQASWLVGLGCHLHQGWRYAKALPADQVTRLCRSGGFAQSSIDPPPGDERRR